MRKIWNYFDKAFVINLDSRPDRMNNISLRLNALDIEYERFSAIRPTALNGFSNLGYYGATLSHLTLWQKIQEEDYERALIFEDDAVFRDDTNQIMNKVTEQAQDLDWEIIYLGVVPYLAKKKVTPNLRELRRGVHFHAYAVNRKSLKQLIYFVSQSLAMHNKKVVDVVISQLPIKKFHVDPILVVQGISSSDTGGANNRLAEYFKYFPVDDFLAHCPKLAKQIKDEITEYRKLYPPKRHR